MAGKKDGFGLLVILAILILLFFYFSSDKEIESAILPELDNRITYLSKPSNLGTEFIKISDYPDKVWENDNFICKGWTDGNFLKYGVFAGGCRSQGGGGWGNCITKKDFAGLKIFLKVAISADGGKILIGNEIISRAGMHSYEIVPDYLNIGIYNIYIDGEFSKRIQLAKDEVFITSTAIEVGCNVDSSVNYEYIKFVPIEAFTIKNDEVWVEEKRTGGTYSFNDLEWEMIGFHTELRPATIRNLDTETEVPAPQIYVNLINNLPVEIRVNEIHTFSYRTKFVEGMDSSCKGDLNKVLRKQSDGSWKCESYIAETPIIQQCQVKEDCPILPECEAQRDLIECIDNFCDYIVFSPECRNQLIVYQEKITEIEKEKFIPIPSGANSFFCFFNKDKTFCNMGEKKISIISPKYVCDLSDGIITTGNTPNSCWETTLSFNGDEFDFNNNKINQNIGYNIKVEISMSAMYSESKLKSDWAIVAKITLPDDFLEIKSKELGNKFILKDSVDKITFTITNKLFGINGGYTIQTQNLALEGGVVLRDEINDLFLREGDNDITYNFRTDQLGTIVDVIGVFGKVTTDREYIMKSSKDGKQKFLVLTKEVVTEIPEDVEKLEPVIIEKEVIKEIPVEPSEIPIWVKIIGGIIGLFIILKLFDFV